MQRQFKVAGASLLGVVGVVVAASLVPRVYESEALISGGVYRPPINEEAFEAGARVGGVPVSQVKQGIKREFVRKSVTRITYRGSDPRTVQKVLLAVLENWPVDDPNDVFPTLFEEELRVAREHYATGGVSEVRIRDLEQEVAAHPHPPKLSRMIQWPTPARWCGWKW